VVARPMNETGLRVALAPAAASTRAAKRLLSAATATYRALTCRFAGHDWQPEPDLGTGQNCYVCASCDGLTVSPGGKPAPASRPMTELTTKAR
jgi:hypothetical protein